MTGAKEKWRSIGVYNSWTLLRAYTEDTGMVWLPMYISYSHNDGSRSQMGNLDGYYVMSPYFKTDPQSKYWRDYENKAFSTISYHQQADSNRERRERALWDAIEWCNIKYGTVAWRQIPGFGRDWFPAQVADWAADRIRKVKL